MTACADRQRVLARLADASAGDPPAPEDRAELEAHLARCAACREALDEQRLVSAILRSRPVLAPSSMFAGRLASRLDDASGWLGFLDWQAWTFRLAPLAVALAIAAAFTSLGAERDPAGIPQTSDTSTATLDAWTRSIGEPSSVVSAVWQEGASADALVETMLTGGARETGHAR